MRGTIVSWNGATPWLGLRERCRGIVRHRWYLLFALAGVLIVAAACGNDEPGDDDQAGQGSLLQEPMEIVGLTWTSAVDSSTGEPVDRVESFTTISPSVVAVVEARNVPAGTEFTTTWMIDGLDVPEATMQVTVEDDMATAWVAFEFIRDDGRYFPLGELSVTVDVSSGESIDDSVDIQLP
jgi:hypothetical protein